MAFQMRKLYSATRASVGALTYTVPANYRATIANLTAEFISAAGTGTGDTCTFTAVLSGVTHTLLLTVVSLGNAQIAFFSNRPAWANGEMAAFPRVPYFVPVTNMTLEAGDSITMTTTKAGAGQPSSFMTLSGVLEAL